jgi:hypothetical protein
MRFSGHETFICKQFWLKKGYDFLLAGNKFSDNNAVVELGVGKNMVAAIGFWMKAFGVCDDKWNLTEKAHYIFAEDGKDKYLEDIGTIWLLHYFLVKENYASIYNYFYNNFRREYPEFTNERLHNNIKPIAEADNSYNENTISADISVLLRMYQRIDNTDSRSELEDSYSSIFNDLQLIHKIQTEKNEEKRILPSDEKVSLPAEIVLYAILDNYRGEEIISFRELHVGYNSPGMIFGLTKEGLYSKIEEITKNYRDIVFSSNAGVQVLQFKSPIDKWSVLDNYYDGN